MKFKYKVVGKSKVLMINHEMELEWYDEVDADSYYEKHLEDTVLSKLKEVYPDYVPIKFSQDIETGTGEVSRPDLAMIKKDYTEWYVIEVEMGRHDWDGHVEKQVRVFSTGIYDKDKVSKYIFDKDNSLDQVKLADLVDSGNPKVMVIVNEQMPEWEKRIKKFNNSFVSVFQVFKGVNGFEVYRVAGDTPFIYRDKSPCSFLSGLSNTLHINYPDFIKEAHDEVVEVTFKGRKTKWKRMDSKNKVHLIYEGRTHNLQLEKDYVLYINDQDEYFLELN